MIKRGYRSLRLIQSKPSRAITPGRKLSTRTSALASNSSSVALSATCFKFSAMLRLLRFHIMNGTLSPARNGGVRRTSSPSGGSTLITSAP